MTFPRITRISADWIPPDPRHPRKIPALRVSAISAAFCKIWIEVLPAERREFRISEN